MLATSRSAEGAGDYPVAGLLDWMESPRAGRGLYFANDAGGFDLVEFPRLAELVMAAAEEIAAVAARPGGAISLQLPTGPGFVSAFIGSLVAGYTPSPLPPPTFMRNQEHYVAQLTDVIRAADPAAIVSDPAFAEAAAQAAERAGTGFAPVELELSGDGSGFERRAPADLALLQFTSGSSGRPRGVEITWANLESNIRMIRHWLRMRPDDQTVTWLPLYHDMGLIGCLLTPIVNQSDVWIFRPDQFIVNPRRWIECLGTRAVEIAVSPSFGFAYAAKHVRPEHVEDHDFSAWRIAICGAERLDPEALRRFSELLAPRGFRPETFLPAYGLAEATLAVTGVHVPDVPRAVRPDWDGLRFGYELEIEAEAPIDDADTIGDGSGWLVGCGPPLLGAAVEIVDDEGDSLGEDRVGEIAVIADTVARGYQGGDNVGSTSFSPDGLRTGDAGFVHGGELYVVGRIGDALKTRGRAVFVEDLEAKVCAHAGLPKGRVAVLAGTAAGADSLVALVEVDPGGWEEEVGALLARELGPDGVVRVLAGPRGTIQRTSSGKPRRRVLWRQLLEGALEADVVYERANGAARPV
ncbi:MAG: AMP-binding protein [Actinomycetota bacterium]|nr:AMP-binding protein [Actinomycetota bacterium]